MNGPNNFSKGNDMPNQQPPVPSPLEVIKAIAARHKGEVEQQANVEIGVATQDPQAEIDTDTTAKTTAVGDVSTIKVPSHPPTLSGKDLAAGERESPKLVKDENGNWVQEEYLNKGKK